ncbi:hypothetical protein ACIBL5_39105 [Streptomyces sp. NPDC050516]|uniref:hypothetical protein n=1 Tax=Streptomyces sp. NPDC050516 TaxID=3365621 RepID=UPI00378D92CA
MKLLVVADAGGAIKAAAVLNPENEHAPKMIELKSAEEILHEVEFPEELQAEGLRDLDNYYVEADPEPRLVRRTA